MSYTPLGRDRRAHADGCWCSRSRWSAPRSCCWAAGGPTAGATCSAALPRRLVRVRRARVLRLLGQAARPAPTTSTCITWIPVARLQRRRRPPHRPAVDHLRAADHRGRLADPHLLDRLHGARRDRRRFFAYLNLFLAAMLLLVLADNYLLLYAGWEGVGLASYLLIGFWQYKPVGGGRGQEGVHRQPGRRRRPVGRHHADVRRPSARFASRACSARSRRRQPGSRPRSGCCCCSGPAASRPSSRCSPGCWTRWRARPRSRR